MSYTPNYHLMTAKDLEFYLRVLDQHKIEYADVGWNQPEAGINRARIAEIQWEAIKGYYSRFLNGKERI